MGGSVGDDLGDHELDIGRAVFHEGQSVYCLTWSNDSSAMHNHTHSFNSPCVSAPTPAACMKLAFRGVTLEQ
jgi:hypothetical protein